MITIFTSAKGFTGISAVHQVNALESWRRLAPGIEVLVFGEEEGSAEAAKSLGFTLIPEIARSELGTPLLDQIFFEAAKRATHPLLAFVNADILLTSSFLQAVQHADQWGRPFVMIGQRRDLTLDELVQCESDWDDHLTRTILDGGTLSATNALDFFVFSKCSAPALPPFAIGRPGWDNWLVRDVLDRGLALIDATPTAVVGHPRHGYGHVKSATGRAWEGPEANRNRHVAMTDGRPFLPHLYTTLSASWVVTPGGVAPADDKDHVEWRAKMRRELLMARLKPIRTALGKVVRALTGRT